MSVCASETSPAEDYETEEPSLKLTAGVLITQVSQI